MLTKLRAKLYALTGHRRWYQHYRSIVLPQVLERPFDINNLPLKYGWRMDERVVEYPWFFSRLPDLPGTLLDGGSVLNHSFLVRHHKLKQKDVTIITLAPELECFWREGISYVYGDLRHTCFRDGHFDYVVSLSTLEHIGLNNTLFYTADKSCNEKNPGAYLAAVGELRRILRPGGVCFISVPFGKHSVREWLQVFDGAMVDSIIETFRARSQSVTYFRYSDARGWQLSTRESAMDSVYFDPTRDSGWKGCPMAAEAVACLELMK